MIGRVFGLLALCILAAGCARTPASDTNSREVLGVISEIAEDRQSVVISHEDIPGFMDAMVMRFKVTDPSVLKNVEPDNEVRFRLALKPEPHITEIKVLENTNVFPAFKLKSIDGSEVDSAQLKGKVVLVNFWATWCAPCRVETPWLVELKTQYQERGFEIIGIAIDPENEDEIKQFGQEFKVNYPLVYSDGKIENEAGGMLGIPTSYLIDREGKIIKKHMGIITKDALAAEIQRLL